MARSPNSLMNKAEIYLFEKLEDMSREAAKRFIALAKKSIEYKDFFSVVLSGGSTPKRLFQILAGPSNRDQFDWERILFFWGDERCVPPDHRDSNFKMAFDLLLSELPIQEKQIYRMKGELPPHVGAKEYNVLLQDCFELWQGKNEFPVFDLILLGLGNDGHTASLFPESPALTESKAMVVATSVPKAQPAVPRLTLTFPVINNAKHVWFLAAGSQKRALMEEILTGNEHYPAAAIKPTGNLNWFLADSVDENNSL